MAPRLAILTVAYHSEPVLSRLAEDLARQSRPADLWMLVNNAPGGAPLRATTLPGGAARRLQILDGEEDEGFGAGCNRGFEELARNGWRDWVWLLNPDTRLPGGNELRTLLTALESQPPDALIGTAVANDTGELEPSAGWIDAGPAFRRRRVTPALRAAGRPVPLDWLSGCSLCLRPTAHDPPARFDPAFPLYYEDMDLCCRLQRRGVPILWLPEPVVRHRRGQGSATSSPRRLRLSTLGYLRFLQRHCPPWVLLIRTLRLLLRHLVMLPLQPRRSLTVLAAVPAALRRPPPPRLDP